MNYRKLGATGLSVSEIGFGAWGIGGARSDVSAYGPTDDQESKKALWRAYQMGVTFFDTADLYGEGHSERLIGEVFKPVRGKVVIATKVGFVGSSGKQDFSIPRLEQALKESLNRLQTGYIDLYQLHSAPLEVLEKNKTILKFLRARQEEGTIRAFGVAVSSPDDGVRAVKDFGFKAVQANFNAIDQRAIDNGLFDVCAKENAGIICRTPLCYGFLTGKYPADSKFHEKDHRAGRGGKQVELWANAHRLFEPLINENKEQTGGQFALRFCLSYPAVSTAIPGMLTEAHVIENVEASELGPITNSQRARVEKIYRENSFFLDGAK